MIDSKLNVMDQEDASLVE